ncbi:MAG: PhoH family protein [Verrucomicrobia bacterium]|nr:PhoH family protein [Verrucomicrobiota bacterium]
MAERTLHYQNPRFLADLYGGDERQLSELEGVFNIAVVTRDDWIRFEGEEESVLEQVVGLFEILEAGRKNGLRVTPGDFRNIMLTVHEGRAGEMRSVFHESMVIQLRRKSIVPKTINQKRYLQSIATNEIVFGVGPAGTGKTYLAVAAALDALAREKVERIILTRPAVEAGEALGFLPGDLTEKIQPYLLPLYDAIYDMLGRADGRRLIGLDIDKKDDRAANSKIEIAPLAYMRGRTLSNAFVILDEAQNTTPEQMMMFLTRLGEGSRMVVTGDITQIDLPRHKYSGLKEAIKVLGKVPGIDFHFFEGKDVVRNPLVQKIIEAYKKYEDATGAHRPREVQAD